MASCVGCGLPLQPSRGTKPRKWCSSACRSKNRDKAGADSPSGPDTSTATTLDEVLRLLAGAARSGSVGAMNSLLRYHTQVESRSGVPTTPDAPAKDPFDDLDEGDELSRRRAA